MLKTRLLTAAVAIPLLVWLTLWSPSWVFDLVVLSFTALALREFAGMGLQRVPGGTTLTLSGGMAIALSMWADPTGTAVSAGIVVCLALTLLGTLATAQHMEESVDGAGRVLLGALYGGLLLPHVIWLRELPEGPKLVFFVIGCCMGSDAGGYFGGRAFGKRPLWPSVSPNKTIEGAASSVLGSLLVAALLATTFLHLLDATEIVLVGVTVSVLAQLGDLLESMIKRAYGVKDSGWILPGHGGVLDRTDSLVLPIVFIYYYALLGTG